ncbi:bifunctional cobalt-precorrin-7 (C(5))-methyltransferase/cobalt-precorrin-6B (C(15))-methyltransferase [Faecalicatena acetigenes]|jgi:precorrin-6Y C5,15-methyltransferase (decarboxylating)|uniref:Bifunctional cobalt-precorrin-7 (C(5))-methyltransferase/cobalt-precorrin-6B (C(15))-methyltransferase n=1 Tax=Faecalicatena acetigenes TaxID=2981790 RepID=A0ABT2T8J9_9FIRM|nr:MULTISPECIES: bifunctional cobalt-precorrin-7 (C(5))-methyltransferase/cobalt-precorrin-6B (C(15))-methyltransferase [Lachnospiraceae]MCU6746536.1 bifunctional cobalt-precorrin-7 (C(5))-methyltransferase/cobalt-precorrin-6B (C(15))-methyltransferase [Faecalicatena acetigenes]SCH23428.1 Probable cobalt-precorrin-6Y C(15)-methyltransferase [decarboxylating] [uncultured Clostridium sp.]
MCEKEKKVYLLGIGMGDPKGITGEVKDVLLACGCVIGAERLIRSVFDKIQQYLSAEEAEAFCSKERLAEYRADEIARFIKNHKTEDTFAVVLSGDTGFYSGAKNLVRALQNFTVSILPGVSSVSYLAARLGISWEDAAIVSMHGQKANFIYEILHNEKTFLLLGTKGQEGEICRKIKYYGLEEMQAVIGKNLSYPDEQILAKRSGDLTAEDVKGLSVALFLNAHPHVKCRAAVQDAEFIRGKVPMTKEEIRTVCLSKLQLEKGAVLYDIGAGTGSVSVEAALSDASVRVYAVEKNPEAVSLLEENKRKFAADWMEIVKGTAPEVLEDLPVPSHVFIGGGSRNLKTILQTVRLKNPEVRIVLTAISLETVKEAMEAMEEGLLPSAKVIQMAVARSRSLGKFHMMMGENPIYIISAGGKECS